MVVAPRLHELRRAAFEDWCPHPRWQQVIEGCELWRPWLCCSHTLLRHGIGHLLELRLADQGAQRVTGAPWLRSLVGLELLLQRQRHGVVDLIDTGHGQQRRPQEVGCGLQRRTLPPLLVVDGLCQVERRDTVATVPRRHAVELVLRGTVEPAVPGAAFAADGLWCNGVVSDRKGPAGRRGEQQNQQWKEPSDARAHPFKD